MPEYCQKLAATTSIKKFILLDIITLFTINVLSNTVYINCTVKWNEIVFAVNVHNK